MKAACWVQMLVDAKVEKKVDAMVEMRVGSMEQMKAVMRVVL